MSDKNEVPQRLRAAALQLVKLFAEKNIVQCIIQTYGGKWTLSDHGLWGVDVTPRIWACPIAKIEKQFDNGADESVASFVEMIPIMDKKLESGEIGPKSQAS